MRGIVEDVLLDNLILIFLAPVLLTFSVGVVLVLVTCGIITMLLLVVILNQLTVAIYAEPLPLVDTPLLLNA